MISVKDELDFEALPIEIQNLAKRVMDYYERDKEEIYNEGFNDGIELPKHEFIPARSTKLPGPLDR